MKITVRDQVDPGCMGDGWIDSADRGYAKYLSDYYRSELARRYPDAELSVSVDTGLGLTSPQISVDGVTGDDCYEIESEIETIIGVAGQNAWGSWCGGDGEDFFLED